MTTNAQSKQRVQVPDINVLPGEYRRTATTGLTWLLMLVLGLVVFGLYVLYPLQVREKAVSARLSSQMIAGQQELKGLQASQPQAKDLKDSLAGLETKKNDLQASWDTLQQSRIHWRMVLDGIQGSIPADSTIDSLTQKDAEVNIHGIAPSLVSVVQYANSLRRLGIASDLGMTYEARKEGDISFNLRLVVKTGASQ